MPFLNILQTRANNEGKQRNRCRRADAAELAELAERGGMGTYFACQACKSAQYFYSISQDIRIFCELRVGEEEYHTMANTANRVGGGALLVAPDRVRKGLRRGTVCP